ncbi:MAG: flagellar basal body rod protein FlgB [Desulfuromonadales bacterium]|nr:flagellar basal body rod protein FlgB [Desulfuromonadales bacterium]
MANIRIADRTINVLQKSLDLRSQKQQVIAGNIANAETPGYKARKLSFEDNLRQAINRPEMVGRSSNSKHFPISGGSISSVHATITKELGTSVLGDGNTVSVDDEMIDLAENQLLYEASSQILKKKFSMLKFAAGDGR